MYRTNKAGLLAGLLSALVASGALAGEAKMNFHGTLIAPPICTVNGNKNIDVNFGDQVGTNRVDGKNYLTPIYYPIKCQTGASGWVLKLTLTGVASAFDKEAVASDKTDLAIRILQNDQPFTPGTTLDVELNKLPKLQAVPVKRAGSTLTEGVFGATATLRAEYE